MAMKIGPMGAGRTAISTADADSVTVRGRDLCGELMGGRSFTEFFLLALLGREPTEDQRFFVDAMLIAIAEHGLTPSVQAARMTLAAGPEAFQGAVAASVLGCGSVILGSSDAAGAFLADGVAEARAAGEAVEVAARRLAVRQHAAGRPLPGFGHPLHKPVDPRAERLIDLARQRGVVGDHTRLALALRDCVAEVWGKPLPLNVSGAIPAILLDLDFPLGAMKGIPILARVAGTIAHLNEETARPIGFRLAHAAARDIDYDGG
ncbi:MAG: citryl-CoA lyase [Azospirillaceae bacterium]